MDIMEEMKGLRSCITRNCCKEIIYPIKHEIKQFNYLETLTSNLTRLLEKKLVEAALG